MSKQMKKTIFGILGGIVLMLLIAYVRAGSISGASASC